MTKPYLPEILRLFLTDDSTKQYRIEFRGSMDFYIFQLIWKKGSKSSNHVLPDV